MTVGFSLRVSDSDGDLVVGSTSSGAPSFDTVKNAECYRQALHLLFNTRLGSDHLAPEVGLDYGLLAGLFDADFIAGAYRAVALGDARTQDVRNVKVELVTLEDRAARKATITLDVIPKTGPTLQLALGLEV